MISPLIIAGCLLSADPAPLSVDIRIDARGESTRFPHFWEKTFGSGRAILSLRESYRDDLRTVKQATGFESVRFHGILMDELGLYDPDRRHRPAGDTSDYNFAYIDQVYDGLLKNHVRPFVELGFMPRKLAADPAKEQAFWYRPVVSPPKDYKLWDDMIHALGAHLVGRYGINEVAAWRFEVWNEPNIDFWAGEPKQSTYFELYDHTARALKSVSARLQVGGPSTAQAAWVTAFLAHTHEQDVPVDFVSTHVYGTDTAHNVFGTEESIPRDAMVARAVKKVHEEILASAYPRIPLHITEFNASASNEPNVTDSTYMGPWLANTVRLCDGMTDSMAYWCFSDVFEEQGVNRTPFYGGFGLIGADNIPKPSVNVFAALHKLGEERLHLDCDSALATLGADGSVAVALWNYAPPTGTGDRYTAPTKPAGPDRLFTVHIDNVPPAAAATVWRVDEDHGNVVKAFNAMGRPVGALSVAQIAALKSAGEAAPPQELRLERGELRIAVPAHGLAVVVVSAH